MGKKTKKNGFWRGVLFTLFVIAGVIVFSKFFLPKILAKKLIEDETIKSSINYFEEENILEEKAIKIITGIEKEEVAKAFETLEDKEIISDDDKLRFLEEMGIDEEYHAAIVRKMNPENMKKAAKKYEDNKEKIETFFPLIKETMIESIKKMNYENNN
jgi:ribosomal protein L4